MWVIFQKKKALVFWFHKLLFYWHIVAQRWLLAGSFVMMCLHAHVWVFWVISLSYWELFYSVCVWAPSQFLICISVFDYFVSNIVHTQYNSRHTLTSKSPSSLIQLLTMNYRKKWASKALSQHRARTSTLVQILRTGFYSTSGSIVTSGYIQWLLHPSCYSNYGE